MGVRNGDVLLYRTLQDKAGMLTPNITTLYAFSFWDLAKQAPPGGGGSSGAHRRRCVRDLAAAGNAAVRLSIRQ